jgi:hypothetical protein
MGSDSELPTMKQAADTLAAFGVAHEVRVVSAHRTPRDMARHARVGRAARAGGEDRGQEDGPLFTAQAMNETVTADCTAPRPSRLRACRQPVTRVFCATFKKRTVTSHK